MAKAFEFSGVKEPTVDYKDKEGKEVSKPLWETYQAIAAKVTALIDGGSEEMAATQTAVSEVLEIPGITVQQALEFQAYMGDLINGIDAVKKILRLNANSQATASNRKA